MCEESEVDFEEILCAYHDQLKSEEIGILGELYILADEKPMDAVKLWKMFPTKSVILIDVLRRGFLFLFK